MPFLREIEKDTGKAPKALQEMPQVLPHQAQYLEAFQTLCEWRGYTGLGDLAPLTLADMNSYFSIYRVESLTERENLLLHIKALDMLFLKSASEKKAEASKSDVR